MHGGAEKGHICKESLRTNIHSVCANHSQKHHLKNIEAKQHKPLNWELLKGKQEGPTLMSDAVI